jgi:putative addiction module component (TIGR02574 family)
MTKQQILQEARHLSRDERIDLAMDLWETVEGDAPPISSELRQELDRRLVDDEANPAPAEEWGVLREKLLRGEY